MDAFFIPFWGIAVRSATPAGVAPKLILVLFHSFSESIVKKTLSSIFFLPLVT